MKEEVIKRILTVGMIFILAFGRVSTLYVWAEDHDSSVEVSKKESQPRTERTKKIEKTAIQPTNPASERHSKIPQGDTPTPTQEVSSEISETDKNSQNVEGDGNFSLETGTPTPTSEVNMSLTPTPTRFLSRGSSGTRGYETGNTKFLGKQNTSPDDPVNKLTGPYSDNYASLSNSSEESIQSSNEAVLINSIDAGSSTGGNNTDFSTSYGSIETGDATVDLNVVNTLNANFTGAGGVITFDIYDQHVGDIIFDWADVVSDSFNTGNPMESVASASSAVVQNSTTGPGSTNEAVQTDSSQQEIENINDAVIEQDIDVAANTGSNSASYNTGKGSIKTGDATAFANVVNFVNTSLVVDKWLIGIVNIFGSLYGDIILPSDSEQNTSNDAGTILVENQNTGPMSENTAEVEIVDTDSFQNINDAAIVNNISVEGITGNNDASLTTGGSVIKTGASNVSVSENTVANQNIKSDDTVWLVIVNELGHWVGYIVGEPWGQMSASSDNIVVDEGSGDSSAVVSNVDTGPFSENKTSLSKEDETVVKDANQATLVNNITVDSITGENSAVMNTGGSLVETGKATAGLNLFNMANTNVQAPKFVAVFVNVLGEFFGSIVPPDSAENSDSNAVVIYDNQAFTNGNIVEESTESSSADNTAIGGVREDSQLGNDLLADDNNSPFQSQQQIKNQFLNFDQPVQENSDNVYSNSIAYTENTNQSSFAKDTQAANSAKEAKSIVVKKSISNSAVVSELFYSYLTPLSKKYSRGPFVSVAVAKTDEGSSSGILVLGTKYRVTSNWLVLVPIAIFITMFRRRYVFKKYISIFMEVIL